jgi:hypothetical protein
MRLPSTKKLKKQQQQGRGEHRLARRRAKVVVGFF